MCYFMHKYSVAVTMNTICIQNIPPRQLWWDGCLCCVLGQNAGQKKVSQRRKVSEGESFRGGKFWKGKVSRGESFERGKFRKGKVSGGESITSTSTCTKILLRKTSDNSSQNSHHAGRLLWYVYTHTHTHTHQITCSCRTCDVWMCIHVCVCGTSVYICIYVLYIHTHTHISIYIMRTYLQVHKENIWCDFYAIVHMYTCIYMLCENTCKATKRTSDVSSMPYLPGPCIR